MKRCSEQSVRGAAGCFLPLGASCNIPLSLTELPGDAALDSTRLLFLGFSKPFSQCQSKEEIGLLSRSSE